LLDQDSLDWAQRERGWGWPWPRYAYAEIVDYMKLSGAKTVAFDMIFSEPSIYINSRQDEIINNTLNDLKKIAAVIADGQLRAENSQVSMLQLLKNNVDVLHILENKEDDASFARAGKDFEKFIHTVFFSGVSGKYLSWPDGLNPPSLRPFTMFDGKAIPGLSSAALLVSGKDPQISYGEKSGFIDRDGISIPINKTGEALLRYRGDLGYKYMIYFAKDILQSAEAVKKGDEEFMSSWDFLEPDYFYGAYIFFGLFAPGLYDVFNTPISAMYPGVGCHVTMLDNMLNGNFIREISEWQNMFILFIVIGFTVLLTMFLRRIFLFVSGMVVIVLVIFTGAFIAYQWGGLWIPVVSYLAGTAAAFITVTLYN
jgi:adenylate cyclase